MSAGCSRKISSFSFCRHACIVRYVHCTMHYTVYGHFLLKRSTVNLDLRILKFRFEPLDFGLFLKLKQHKELSTQRTSGSEVKSTGTRFIMRRDLKIFGCQVLSSAKGYRLFDCFDRTLCYSDSIGITTELNKGKTAFNMIND